MKNYHASVNSILEEMQGASGPQQGKIGRAHV